MKKLIILLLTVVVSCGICVSETVKIGDLYYRLNGAGSNLVDYSAIVDFHNRYRTDIVNIDIPSSVTYQGRIFPVIEIDEDAFRGCTELVSVTIPNSVTYIGGSAFTNCTNLKSITIPNSVLTMDGYYGEFKNCTSLPVINNIRYADTYLVEVADTTLSSYTIKEGTRFIGAGAFEGCKHLKSISIPSSVISIEPGAFSGCDSLQVTINNNVRYIDTYLIGVTDKTLSTYTIKEGTRFIGAYAFSDCNNLTSITLPTSLVSIGQGAFENCKKLTSLTIHEGVAFIGEAFHNCTGLTEINLPNSVVRICSPFDGCSNIVSANLGNGLKELRGFGDCEKLKSVTIPGSLTRVTNNSFRIVQPKEIHYNGTVAEWCSKTWWPYCIADEYSLYFYDKEAKNVIIPEGVKKIGGWCAFRGCINMESLTIPSTCNSIYQCAFEGCTALKTIHNNSTIPQYVDACMFDGVDRPNCLLIVPSGTANTYKATAIWKEFRIIDDECIGGYGLCGDNLEWTLSCDTTTLKITGSGAMFDYAIDKAPWYKHNDSIRTIILPAGLTYIGAHAFSGLSNVKKVRIPGKVTSIGQRAFANCKGLQSLSCEAVVPPVCATSVFSGVNKSIPLYVPNRSLNAYKAADQWKDFFPSEQGPTSVPTVTELKNLYGEGNNLVLCVYFEETPCSAVYLVGSYRLNEAGGWSTDISELARFEPIMGFEGWYAVIIPYDQSIQGRLVQLTENGEFVWDHQSGDVNAWINKGGDGTKAAVIDNTSMNEATLTFSSAGFYIYELDYWKNHQSPCAVIPSHDYTIQIYSPDACEDMMPLVLALIDNEYDYVVLVEEKDAQNKKFYTATLPSQKEGSAFWMTGNVGGWDNLLQHYDSQSNTWEDISTFFMPEATKDTTLVFDLSDNEMYRYTFCQEGEVNVFLAPPDGAPKAVEMLVNFNTQNGIPMQYDESTNLWFAKIYATYQDNVTFREAGAVDENYMLYYFESTEEWGKFTLSVGRYWSDGKDGNKVLNFDLTDSNHFKWQRLSPTTEVENNPRLVVTPSKLIRNGQLFILRDGKTYTVQGQEVK